MSSKHVRVRATAESELQLAIAYYLSEGAHDAASDLIDEFEHALKVIGEYPGIGSAWLEAELGLPGVRAFSFDKFPYLIVYFDTAAFVDVRHMLHTRVDIPRRLSE